ncbi:hypothetical protein K443DRAFT_681021 [Laccaria amethystina LaAM-08-1]|uniref:DUF7918 domain-containing protein n=1 Tax=Laccaria amethystina LaAM-08-1 TaxID=1095629 RepID=A0A0C9WZ68_9AGAR|nr:hypothetical protein K443DRAFT_681021 [Laccaria amethystina LaAM-08-1]
MLQFGNHKGWISVDNNELPEYGVQYSEDEKIATCWIPSKVGKNFVICWKNDGCSFHTASRIIIDGVKMGGCCVASLSKPRTSRERGVKTSAATERPFIFSKVELTDDDDFLTASPGLGEIRLRIDKVEYMGSSTRYRKPPTLSHKVHERSKKGIVHGTSLGDEVETKQENRRRTRTIEHLATFVFKYRPLDVLQADGIAPNDTPTAAVQPEPSKVEDVAESSGSLAARKRALMEELRQIEELESRKRKSDGAEGGRVKKERRELVQLGGIIDLT